MTFRTKFLLFVPICVPPNNPITACGVTSFPGYHSFPKWAISYEFAMHLIPVKGEVKHVNIFDSSFDAR